MKLDAGLVFKCFFSRFFFPCVTFTVNLKTNTQQECFVAVSQYLDYPVFGLQSCPLRGGVFVHGSDVLARPRPLTVQVEAKSVGLSPDHAQTWSQLGAHLLQEDGGENADI